VRFFAEPTLKIAEAPRQIVNFSGIYSFSFPGQNEPDRSPRKPKPFSQAVDQITTIGKMNPFREIQKTFKSRGLLFHLSGIKQFHEFTPVTRHGVFLNSTFKTLI
jgi:hypothetical protein